MALRQLVSVLILCGCLVAAKEEDFTDAFNVTLQGFLENSMTDPITLPLLPKIPLHIEGIATLEIILRDIDITGQSLMRAENCIYNDGTSVVEMSLVLPTEAITSGKLMMTGVILDNIFIDGEGPASFVLENLRMTIRGNTSQNTWDGPAPVLVFTDAVLELVLERWTVEMEGLTPDSDLGTLMNSFFSGIGPDVFHVLADLINQTDLVLKILNSFFPPPAEETSNTWEPEAVLEVIDNEIVDLLSKYLYE